MPPGIGKTRSASRPTDDAAAGPPRGILRATDHLPVEGGHARRAPAPALVPWVVHYWMVDWRVPPGGARVVQLAPHPNVHLVCEGREALVHGVHTAAFARTLEGQGRVFGIKFRAGAFRTVLGRPVATLRDTTTAAAEIVGRPVVESWLGALRAAESDDARARAADAFVQALDPRRDPDADAAAALVAQVEADRDIQTVEILARRAGLGVRGVQRLFREYVGVTPKWVIRRYRVHDLIERLNDDPRPDWAAAAAELGYFDQSHLIREFRTLFGCGPAEYVRRHARG